MAIKIVSLASAIGSRGTKILSYGDAGTGKTFMISTLPGKVLIASAEAGLLSLSAFGEDPRFSVVEINSIAGLREVYSHIRKPGHGYDWVVLDSISEIAETCLTEEKAKTKDPRQAYGAIQDEVGSILRAFRDLEINVYFSAKQAREKDEATSRISYGIAMPGSKLGPSIPYLFDEVFRLVVNKEEDGTESRWLLTRNDGRSVAKDRSGMLDPYEPADLGAIAAKIRGAAVVVAPSTSSNSFEKHNEDNDVDLMVAAEGISDVERRAVDMINTVAIVAASDVITLAQVEDAAAQPAKTRKKS